MNGFFGKLLKRIGRDAPQPVSAAHHQSQQQFHQKAPRTSTSESGRADSDSDGTLVAPGLVSSGSAFQGRSRRKAFSRQTSKMTDSEKASTQADNSDFLHSLSQKLADARRSNSLEAKGLASRSSLSSSSLNVTEEPFARTYHMLQPLHSGRHCKVMQGVERKGATPVVIKVYSKKSLTATRREMIFGEVEFLRKARDCPSIVTLKTVAEDADNHYTVLEKCEGRTLIELMASCGGKLSERRCAIEIAAPLVQAVSQLHELGIVHRNLKPEHIICSMSGLKLLDFLDAGDASCQCLNHRTGVKEYMAPEVLNKPRAEDIFHQVLFNGMAEEELPQYDVKVDVWSIGVLVYEALSGCQPFIGESVQDVMDVQERLMKQGADCASGFNSGANAFAACAANASNGSSATFCSVSGSGAAPTPTNNSSNTSLVSALAPGFVPEFISKLKLSPGAEDFLVQALQVDPAKRPSAAELLKHPWLTAGYHRYSMQLGGEMAGRSNTSPFRSRAASRNSSFRTPAAEIKAPAVALTDG